MSHSHEHHGDLHHRAFAWAVGLNALFTAIEIFCAWYAGSVSLLADGVHNLADVLSLAFSWFASWLLTRQNYASRFSYGYRRTTILAAFVQALFLVLSSVLLGYQAVTHWLNPTLPKHEIMLLVAIIGVVINVGTAYLFRHGQQHDLNIKGAFLHLLYDALISFAVVLGALLMLWTGWHWVDPVLGIGIAVAIVWGTWPFVTNALDMLLDAVPAKIDSHAVYEYLMGLPGVEAVHDLHIWGLSTKEVALTAHLVMPGSRLTDQDYKQVNQYLSVQFYINHVTLQIECGELNDPCGQASCA